MTDKHFSEFEKEWLSLFAKNIDEKGLREHVLTDGNFIWHIFSMELLPKNVFFAGEEARNAFDAQDKTNAKYYEPFCQADKCTSAFDNPSAKDIEERIECYVISADRTWTYIKTHEGDCCGPYFYKLSGNL